MNVIGHGILLPAWTNSTREQTDRFEVIDHLGELNFKEFVSDVAGKPIVMSVVCRGYLTKQGGVVKNWKRRWFEIEGCSLVYRKDQAVCCLIFASE
jgi:hypothetical protein